MTAEEREKIYDEIDGAAFRASTGRKNDTRMVLDLPQAVYYELMAMLYTLSKNGAISVENARRQKAKYRRMAEDYALILDNCAAWQGLTPEDFTRFLVDPNGWTEAVDA